MYGITANARANAKSTGAARHEQEQEVMTEQATAEAGSINGAASALDDVLAACPCGRVPTELGTAKDLHGKWCMAIPNCCGEWMIEFRCNKETGGDLDRIAKAAWNSAQRGANALAQGRGD